MARGRAALDTPHQTLSTWSPRLVARPVWQQAPGSRAASRHPGAPSTHLGPDFAVLQQDQGGGGLALVSRLVPDNGALRVRVAAHFDVAWRRAGRCSGRGAGSEERRALSTGWGAGRGRQPARPPSQRGRQARNRGGPGEPRQAAPAAGLSEAAGGRQAGGPAEPLAACAACAPPGGRRRPPGPAAARRAQARAAARRGARWLGAHQRAWHLDPQGSPCRTEWSVRKEASSAGPGWGPNRGCSGGRRVGSWLAPAAAAPAARGGTRWRRPGPVCEPPAHAQPPCAHHSGVAVLAADKGSRGLGARHRRDGGALRCGRGARYACIGSGGVLRPDSPSG